MIGSLYPHLKLTNEKFPRMLVTRRVLNVRDTYFGAFLPETGVRIWLGSLNKIFRLRSCEIDIDGNFPQPCQMFYSKRCVAPCVSEICTKASYDEYVTAMRLFLSGSERSFTVFLESKIDKLSEDLDFEEAAKWRDILISAQKIFADKKMRLWLDDVVDSYDIEETNNEFKVLLVTMRGRKFLGGREFIVPKGDQTAEQAIEAIIEQFYVFHAPKEIRLTRDFSSRKSLQKYLSEKFARPIKISIVKEKLNVTTRQKLKQTKFESEFEKIGEPNSIEEIKSRLQSVFRLKKKPSRIECFDVAHISGQDFVAASVVWNDGEIAPKNFKFYATQQTSEIGAMKGAVEDRLRTRKDLPDLILIDGGISHLRAAASVFEKLNIKDIELLSAVKPPRKHNEISHFLTPNEEKIAFLTADQSFESLRLLRDAAHNAANQAHRRRRDSRHLYELERMFRGFDSIDRKRVLSNYGSIKKLSQASASDLNDLIGEEKAAKLLTNIGEAVKNKNIQPIPYVPVRFDEPGGAAEDLPPILSKNI